MIKCELNNVMNFIFKSAFTFIVQDIVSFYHVDLIYDEIQYFVNIDLN